MLEVTEQSFEEEVIRAGRPALDLVDTAASMAPGFEDAELLAATKSSDSYWAAAAATAGRARGGGR